MALPCVDDSCTVQATKVNGHLKLHVKVHPGGGLYEHADCDGLAVQIIGEPDNRVAIDQGLMQLGLTTGGELWVAPGRVQTHVFAGNPVSVPQTSPFGSTLDESANSIVLADRVFTNPFPTRAVIIITGRMMLGYSIPNPGAEGGDVIVAQNGTTLWAPYSGSIEAQVRADIPGPGVVALDTAYFDCSGMALQADTPANRRQWQPFTFVNTIGPGESWTLSAKAAHIAQPGFIEARGVAAPGSTPSTGFGDRGFTCSGRVTILPMNQE